MPGSIDRRRFVEERGKRRSEIVGSRYREILGRDDHIVVVEDAELQTARTDIEARMCTGQLVRSDRWPSDERPAALQDRINGNLTPQPLAFRIVLRICSEPLGRPVVHRECDAATGRYHLTPIAARVALNGCVSKPRWPLLAGAPAGTAVDKRRPIPGPPVLERLVSA